MAAKIYLAGSCGPEDRTRMVNIGRILRGRGYEVYCPFELQISNAWDMSQEAWARKVFEADIRAIEECHIMVIISVGRESTAGTNWEQGYGFALGKTVCVFQITDKPTSLMTYWGSSVFCNSSYERLSEDLRKVLDLGLSSRESCKTILT